VPPLPPPPQPEIDTIDQTTAAAKPLTIEGRLRTRLTKLLHADHIPTGLKIGANAGPNAAVL